jgi:DNA-binding response OmpR family regulator
VARILVVDDEPDVLLFVRIYLEAAGHQTVLAADGERALELLDADPIDLVLLDVCMPVMDGWSVLEAINARRAGAARVVVISGRPAPGDLRRAFELGAADYMRKPFDPDQLLEGVNAVLSRTDEEHATHRARALHPGLAEE